MTVSEIIFELKSLSTPEHYAKLSQFGIKNEKAIGVKVPLLRQLAKKIGVNHALALELWKTELHEARILASFIENPLQVTEIQFDNWILDINSWDICDQCCNLFVHSPFVFQKIEQYSARNEEYVKRAAFVLMCQVALHLKNIEDREFYRYFELIKREANDERNFVRKAVNWSLRQIGKRNEVLRLKAIEVGEDLLKTENKTASWIATDALRELRSEKVIAYVNNRKKP